MRYTVQQVTSFMGPLFQVVDTTTGESVGFPVLWRDEAERRAGNMERRHPQSDLDHCVSR